MKVKLPIIEISAEGCSIIWQEELDKDAAEYFEELQTNGANPHIEKITWEHWTRPIECHLGEIGQFNVEGSNAHFIFGYLESLWQSDRGGQLPFWSMEKILVHVKVKTA